MLLSHTGVVTGEHPPRGDGHVELVTRLGEVLPRSDLTQPAELLEGQRRGVQGDGLVGGQDVGVICVGGALADEHAVARAHFGVGVVVGSAGQDEDGSTGADVSHDVDAVVGTSSAVLEQDAVTVDQGQSIQRVDARTNGILGDDVAHAGVGGQGSGGASTHGRLDGEAADERISVGLGDSVHSEGGSGDREAAGGAEVPVLGRTLVHHHGDDGVGRDLVGHHGHGEGIVLDEVLQVGRSEEVIGELVGGHSRGDCVVLDEVLQVGRVEAVIVELRGDGRSVEVVVGDLGAAGSVRRKCVIRQMSRDDSSGMDGRTMDMSHGVFPFLSLVTRPGPPMSWIAHAAHAAGSSRV